MDSEYLDWSEVSEMNPEGLCAVCRKSGVHKRCSKKWIAIRRQRKREWRTFERRRNFLNKRELGKHSVQGRFLSLKYDSIPELEGIFRIVQSANTFVPPFKQSGIVEGHDWWYLPVRNIGLSAFIFEKSTGKIFEVGGGITRPGGMGTIWPAIDLYYKQALPEVGA